MKSLLLFCVILVTTNALSDWEEYKTQFNKVYKTSNDEIKHKLIFDANIVEIKDHNQKYIEGKVSFYKGINQFSDMTLDEIQRSMGFVVNDKVVENEIKHISDPNKPLPKEVDWRKRGLVTPVKDEGRQCGACWAFSATGAIEGQHAKKTGHLVALSEQNLIDCSRDEGNYGCNGGYPKNSYQYVIKAGGIDTEKAYPYKGEDMKCNFTVRNIGAKISGFAWISSGNEATLQDAVAFTGPVSVCIQVTSSFSGYSGGVLDDTTCSSSKENINFCALVVGYGMDDRTGKDYWLVKNIWGPNWGEGGYIRMSRNKDNQCSIASMASYPVGVTINV